MEITFWLSGTFRICKTLQIHRASVFVHYLGHRSDSLPNTMTTQADKVLCFFAQVQWHGIGRRVFLSTHYLQNCASLHWIWLFFSYQVHKYGLLPDKRRVLEGRGESHSSLNLSHGTRIEVSQNIFGQQSFTSKMEVLMFFIVYFWLLPLAQL